MLTCAIDTPAPATIILISGDRDFVYAVSVLRLRQYHVVVVAPSTAHSTLRSRASIVHDWDGEVLRRSPPSGTHAGFDGAMGRSWADGEGMFPRPIHHTSVSSEALPRSNRRHSFRENGRYSPLTTTPSKPTRRDGGIPLTPDSLRVPLSSAFVFPSPTDRDVRAGRSAKGSEIDCAINENTRGSVSTPLDVPTSLPLDTNLLSPISPARHVRLGHMVTVRITANPLHFMGSGLNVDAACGHPA